MRKTFIQNGFTFEPTTFVESLQTTPSKSKKGKGNVHDQIASIESGGNYSATNPNSSASGKYQFIWSIWGDKIKKHTGVKDRREFLNSPQAQENFYNNYYVPNEMEPAVNRIAKATNYRGNLDSLRKLYHYRGEKGAIDYLNGQLEDKPESYNMPISEYTGIKRYSMGGIISNGIGGVTSGASLGGPYGAIAGGVIGLGSGIIQDINERKQLEKINRSNKSSFSNMIDTNSQNAYTQLLYNQSTQYLAKGGKVNADYEVENKEVVIGNNVNLEGGKQLSSNAVQAVGATHENGGVKGSGGEFVFSDRIEAPNEMINPLLKTLGLKSKIKIGDSFATAAQKLSKLKGKYERDATDYKKLNTDKAMTARINAALLSLGQLQETLK